MAAKSSTRKFSYEWPRPAVTVDVALFTVSGLGEDASLQTLLIQRDLEPFAGRWAIPGGFVHENEDLDAAARRELAEETGVRDIALEQVGAVGTPGRDPRGHTVTIVYAALLAADPHTLHSTGDARAAKWFPTDRLPPLAFDHAVLFEAALAHVRRQLGRSRTFFELLPELFTLTELQSVCEAVLGRPLDRRNFRRKLDDAGFLAEATGQLRTGRHRPAQLYRLAPKRFDAWAAQEGALPF